MGLFEKVTRKFNAPILKIFFFIEKFSLFLERFGNLDFFFFLIYTHVKKVYIIPHETLESKKHRNREQANFKLNHDIANLMWSEAKLGHLLLLGPLRILGTW